MAECVTLYSECLGVSTWAPPTWRSVLHCIASVFTLFGCIYLRASCMAECASSRRRMPIRLLLHCWNSCFFSRLIAYDKTTSRYQNKTTRRYKKKLHVSIKTKLHVNIKTKPHVSIKTKPHVSIKTKRDLKTENQLNNDGVLFIIYFCKQLLESPKDTLIIK